MLRYTIAIHNNGTVSRQPCAAQRRRADDTTYVADTLTLNGLPVGQPDGGVLPIAAGIRMSSVDLTPPVPGAERGHLVGRRDRHVQFDVRVNDAAPTRYADHQPGARHEREAAGLPTDGDGNPATGPEPTVVVVGHAQQLPITKQVSVVGGGAALAGATLEYLVTSSTSPRFRPPAS